MYYLKNGKRVKQANEEYSNNYKTSTSYYPTKQNIENYQEGDIRCSKWVYIVCGIIILLIAILLIYWIFVDKSKVSSTKSITKPSIKSSPKLTKQQFGFRFY